MIEFIVVPLIIGHSEIQDIFNKQQSTSPSVSINAQNFDTSVDRYLANDGNSIAIFRKLLGCELSGSLSTNIYLRCQVDFTNNTIRTKAPDFMHLGIPAVNASDEFNALVPLATIVSRPTNGSHWSVPGHAFGEAKAFGMSGARLEQNYSYKTDFEIRRKNQNFGHQDISMG